MAEKKSRHYDAIIIGAGPAGLQLGYYLSKSNWNYLILEQGKFSGHSFNLYPRHRKLISINKVHTGYDCDETNLRWDWNSLLNDEGLLFKHYSKKYFPDADDLVRYLSDFTREFDLNVQYDTKIERVSKSDRFLISDQNGQEYSSDYLIHAGGVPNPYLPEIPGIDLIEKYPSVSVNPDEFENQKVLVIGKGNSAFETADNLNDTASLIHVLSPNPIRFAWKTHYVGHLRAVNNNFLDTYQLKAQNAVLDATISSIQKKDDKFLVSVQYSHASGEQEILEYDRVILCAGFKFDSSMFDESCKPKEVCDGRFPSQTCEWESENVKGLYFAGVLMAARDYKKTQSGFIHGFRYNIRSLSKILNNRKMGTSIPSTVFSADAQSVTNNILKRINSSSGLWQQFSFLHDVIVFENDSETCRYYEELPIEYIQKVLLSDKSKYIVVSLEFGASKEDPFAIERNPVPQAADQSSFLHPVCRLYENGSLIAEQHLLEDLFGEWKRECHTKPLYDFIMQNCGLSLKDSSRDIELEAV